MGSAAAFVMGSMIRAASYRKVLAALAFLLLTNSAAQADLAAGLEAYDGGDYAAAVAAWLPLAEAGDAEAQVALADLYLYGQGVPADPARAADWYRRAAVQGDAVAQLNLGDLYSRGIGLPRDLAKAYVWLARAAKQGRRWAEEQAKLVQRQLTSDQLAEAEHEIKAHRSPDSPSP